uniref:Uncharacterized protein n=1 Tax=Tanacetum cinerariifolium TaxID=118510 RepID=A0A699GHY1_TANCI|nr:hypothetical protein [Tanacetum cinerariifolium]
MTLPELPNFVSLFHFDQRVSALETKESEFNQTSQFAKVVYLIPGIVDNYIASKLKEEVDVVVQLQSNKLKEKAQAENQEFLNQVDSTMKAIIKDQKNQGHQAHPKAHRLIINHLFKKPEKPPTPDHPWNKRKAIDFRPPQTWISNIAKTSQPPRKFNELPSTPIHFSAYVMNNLKIDNLTQEILKKLNITRLETFRLDIPNMIPYTTYKNPQGIIYQDKFQRNRLMHSDELCKFYDGALSFVKTELHDIASSLEMDYLRKRHWSNLEKKRSRIMIKVIDKLLFERRLMRNLEKFVGGREYGNDLKLLERII